MHQIAPANLPADRREAVPGKGPLRLINRTPRPRARLICFPYAGASASSYQPWRRVLPRDVALFAVQLPGREDRHREAPATDLAALAREVAEELASLPGDAPLLFQGHSFGALLAYETAHAMISAGSPGPRHVFVSGRVAPHLRHDRRPIARLDDDALIAGMRHIGFEGEQLLSHRGFMRIVLPVLRADLTLDDGYRRRSARRIDCPITAFSGADDPIAPSHLVDGWRKHTPSAFSHCRYPGRHFFIHSHASEMADTVLATVEDRASRGSAMTPSDKSLSETNEVPL